MSSASCTSYQYFGIFLKRCLSFSNSEICFVLGKVNKRLFQILARVCKGRVGLKNTYHDGEEGKGGDAGLFSVVLSERARHSELSTVNCFAQMTLQSVAQAIISWC